MKCSNCGADNDASNRFCEQCGTDLSAVNAAAAVAVVDAPATTTCPNCGEPVLPGQAFCDECGTTLPATSATPVQSAASSNDAPTVLSSGTTNGSGQDGSTPASLICSVCGHQNLPGDRFCDNCGADLAAPPASATTPEQAAGSQASAMFDSESPTIIDTSAAPQATIPDMPQDPAESPPAQPPEPIGEPPATPPPPREEPPQPGIPEQDPGENPPPAEAPPAQEPEPIQMQTPAASDALLGELLDPTATPATSNAPTTLDVATYEADRKRLEDEIGRQQQIIAQLEPVETALGVATPQGVQDSLQQARDALASAQSEYDTLQPPAPAVDPAEVARLEDEIGRQQQIIAQLEPVETALGASTPQGVQDSLQQARDALASAQAELAALNGGTSASAPITPAPDASAPNAATAVPAADATTAQANQDAMDQPPAPAASPQPRLVVDDGGAELPFPANKHEIIIGREDPISGVYPEVDLTPYGGESGGVSRQHARLNVTNDQWTIVDLNSTNYTRVDGNKIEPNTPVPVQDGSRIQLGRVAMTFRQK